MRQTIISLLIFGISFLGFNIQRVFAEEEERDFGFQFGMGINSGIFSNASQLTLLMATDFYFLNKSLRMRFGPIFLIENNHIPAGSIHMIGLQYLYEIDKIGSIFLGIDYFKSYFQYSDVRILSGKKGLKYNFGFKKKLDSTLDFIGVMDIMQKPFLMTQEDNNWFWMINIGLVWYF